MFTSKYAADARVVERGNGGYTVTVDGGKRHILYNTPFKWCVHLDTPNMDFMPAGPNGFMTQFPDPDSAIHALIGPPA